MSLRDRFCEEATNWFKMWSTWLAIAYGTVATTFWNDPTLFAAIANALPAQWRAPLSPLIMFLTTGLPIIVRLLKQKKLASGAAG